MAFFRSEAMTLCQMLLHTESAFDCLVELGELGVVQFNNLSDADHTANLKFVGEVQRCSELQRITKRLQDEAEESNISPVFYPDVDTEEIPKTSDLREMEVLLQKIDAELDEVDRNLEVMVRRQIVLKERLHVLIIAENLVASGHNTQSVMAWSGSVIMQLIQDASREDKSDRSERLTKLAFFTGAIPVERFAAFERLMWRMCSGNFIMKHAEIPVLIEDLGRPKIKKRKHAFVVFFVGDIIKEKVKKICLSFSGVIYDFPEHTEERRERLKKLQKEFDEGALVVERSEQHRQRILLLAAVDLYIWRTKIRKILMVYNVLNKLSMVEQLDTHKYMEAECWIPKKKVHAVRKALLRGARRASKGGGATMMFPPLLQEVVNRENKEPPTSFYLNRFTRGFQNLIDAYGTADYQELNPAPFTIITFPFLFAVMFGDVGHGIIMCLFAGWMVSQEVALAEKQRTTRSQNEIFNILFAGRYIILLMGIFSIYTGLVYNDVFSKSFNIFGSQWRVNFTDDQLSGLNQAQLNPSLPENFLGVPVFFGLDTAWDVAGEDAITTTNSLKMKLAVILGVTQMLFGLSLSAVNHIHFKRMSDLLLVCVPQLIFMCSIFFYLCFMIFYKWANYGGHYGVPYHSSCAPSILITFINMLLMKTPLKPPKNCKQDLYTGQKTVQSTLLALAIISIPWLLVGKPLYLIWHHGKIQKMKDLEARRKVKRDTAKSVRKSLVYNVEYITDESSHVIHVADDAEPFNLTEIWIHQGIHTIESVLGSVSHTASYLRLWALSLAHDQLSTVLWNMVLRKGLVGKPAFTKAIVLYVVFWFWAMLTIAILVVMEGLSAFLHCLRLHWVEFQSKFYSGAGEMYYPFRFERSSASD